MAGPELVQGVGGIGVDGGHQLLDCVVLTLAPHLQQCRPQLGVQDKQVRLQRLPALLHVPASTGWGLCTEYIHVASYPSISKKKKQERRGCEANMHVDHQIEGMHILCMHVYNATSFSDSNVTCSHVHVQCTKYLTMRPKIWHEYVLDEL